MIALAFGPGNGVLMSGAFIQLPVTSYQLPVGTCQFPVCRLLALPASSGSRVLEQDASRFEVLANSVGFGKIAAGTGGAARLDERIDLFDRHRRTLVLVAPQ